MADHPGFIPHLNGGPFYEKPPLYYWILAAAFRLAGRPVAAAARAVSVGSCLLILLITFMGLRRAAGERQAAAAVLILATSLGFFRTSQWILLDPLFALFTTLAFWGAFVCLTEGSWAAWLLMTGGLSLAIWTKGLVAPALLAPGWAALLWRRRREGLLRRLRPLATGAALSAAVLACLGGFYLAGGPQALYEFLWVNHIDRFLHPMATGHVQPVAFYLLAIPVAIVPWVLLLPLILRPAFWRGGSRQESALLRPFLGWTVLGGLVVLTAASTKRDTYLLPLLPAVASLLGLAVDDFLREGAEGGGRLRWLLRFVHPWAPAMWALLPPLALWAYSGTLGATGFAFLCLGAVVAVATLALTLRGSAKAFQLQAAAAFVGCAAILFVVVPPLDRVKNLQPFVERMIRAVPGGGPVPALGADETLYGIIPFVTGREVTGLTEDEFVALALSGRRPAYVVEQDDPERFFPRNPHLLGYEVVMQGRFGPARTIRLWRDEMGARQPGEWNAP
jgi:4-amino-4-deoxy-L-arabinose transferase-like glycosyltransferase